MSGAPCKDCFSGTIRKHTVISLANGGTIGSNQPLEGVTFKVIR